MYAPGRTCGCARQPCRKPSSENKCYPCLWQMQVRINKKRIRACECNKGEGCRPTPPPPRPVFVCVSLEPNVACLLWEMLGVYPEMLLKRESGQLVLSVCPSVSLPLYLSISLSISLPSVCLSVSPSRSLPLSPPLSLPPTHPTHHPFQPLFTSFPFVFVAGRVVLTSGQLGRSWAKNPAPIPQTPSSFSVFVDTCLCSSS